MSILAEALQHYMKPQKRSTKYKRVTPVAIRVSNNKGGVIAMHKPRNKATSSDITFLYVQRRNKKKQAKMQKWNIRHLKKENMTYSEYMKSDLWEIVKDKYEKQVQKSCVVCKTSDVDLHHIKYPRFWGDERHRNFAWMCRIHHDEFHEFLLKTTGRKTLKDMWKPFKLWMNSVKGVSFDSGRR